MRISLPQTRTRAHPQNLLYILGVLYVVVCILAFTLESPSMPHFTCDVYVRAADGQVSTQPYTAPTKRGIIRYLDSRFKSPQSAYDIARVCGSGTLVVRIMMLTTPVQMLTFEILPYGWEKTLGNTRVGRLFAAWNIPCFAAAVQSSSACVTSRGILIRNSTFGDPTAVNRNRSLKLENRLSSICFSECTKTGDIPLGKYIPSTKRSLLLPRMLAEAEAQEKAKAERETLDVERIIQELEKVLEDETGDDPAYFDSIVEAGTPPGSGAETPCSPLSSSANSSCDSLNLLDTAMEATVL